MVPTAADNPCGLVLLALEGEGLVNQIGMAGIDDAWCHETESRQLFVAE